MLSLKFIRRLWIILLPVLVIVQDLRPQQDPSFTIEPEYLGVRSGFPAVIPYNIVKRPKVALVLSGGGARGMAAVGILRTLERYNIPLDLIVGTSVGAIVGGLYASGYSADDLEQILTTTDWDELLALTDETRRRDMFFDKKQIEDRSLLVLRFSNFEPVIPPALSTGQRLTNFLNLLVLNSLYRSTGSFDSLKVTFRAVSTDLITGKRVVMQEGDMTEALRAAVAIPLLFSPVVRDSMQLLDGGLVSNIPVDVARSWGADIVIGVDMSSPLRPSDKLTAPWEQADQIMGIMMQLSNQMQLKNADVVIRPELGRRLASDFTKIEETVIKGEEAAEAAIQALRSLIDERTFSDYGNGSESALLTGVRLQFPDGFDPVWSGRLSAAMQGDTLSLYSVQRWIAALYATGDYQAVRFEGEIVGDNTVLRLEPEKYPALTDIGIEGVTLFEKDTLATYFRPLVGIPINHHHLAHATEQLLHEYRKNGYALAAIDHAGLDLRSGIVRFRVSEGLVDRLVITGTQKTKDYVIWRELPFERKEAFRIGEAKKGLDNIYATNLFEQVAYDFEKTDEGEQLVVIKARERYSSLLRFGMKIDDERYAQGSLDARDENFLGIGSELGMRIAGGSRNIFVMGEFKATRLFDSYFTMTLRGYLDQRQVNSYIYSPGSRARSWSRERAGEFRQSKQGGLLSFGTQLERLGNLTIESRIERQRLANLFNNPVTEQEYTIAQLKAATRLDTQDKVPFATGGIVLDLFLESPLAKITNSVGFTRFFIGYESYHTLYAGHTVHPKMQFGFADATMPEAEFFSLGGQQSFFGLREDDQRGRQMFLTSLEYRYKIPFVTLLDLYGKIRYDLGTTWAVVEDIRLRDMRHGIGVTLAANTPVGPMEVSLAKGFYFRDEIDRPVTFSPLMAYFTLGFNL